ncbi:hypothetical protein EMPS_00481 [Entomortierella parvispora]|uniref:HTH CENPB-type domain-containing protein n=1 Tax=Entomortierella parvispora TaxID=205924 RepID=A0A9P3H165_9FUNG|nr:hypothetical protein EMPS_00481 [Entomortierella parvispora]
MKQAELAAWFEARYSFSISQPTISHSLRKSSEILAMGPCAVGIDSTRVRKRPVRHPDLELAIYRWVQSQQLEQQQRWQRRQKQIQHGMKKRIKGQSIKGIEEQTPPPLDKLTGPALVRQAKKIAQEMNIQDTVFCPGWLSRFKSRYNINFVELNEIPPQSQGAITIANDSASCSTLSSGMSTPVSGPTSNSIMSMSLVDVRPSIAIPSSSHGAYSSPQQEAASLAGLQDLDGSSVQGVTTDDTNFGQLVSIASSMDSAPSQQDLIPPHRPPLQQRIIIKRIEHRPPSIHPSIGSGSSSHGSASLPLCNTYSHLFNNFKRVDISTLHYQQPVFKQSLLRGACSSITGP